jgi:peptide/nickel transport system substrate-binding protein
VKRLKVLAAALSALALTAGACGSSKKSSTTTGTEPGGGTATTAGGAVKEGGDLFFSAEQELDTADWLNINAGSAWGVYTIETNTMPRSFDFTPDSTYKPSPLLDGEPALETDPVQKVTYKINPKAVWDDGQPITSHDYKYTWDQIAHGKDIYDTTGYADVASVDEPDPKTAVVTFKNKYAAWRDLFGGFYGIYPSHLLEGKDRDALTKDGYTFSGGPWKLDHWTKGQEIKLVPNQSYWDKKPHFSSVTFKILADTSAEQQAYKSGQVSAVYPQAQPGQEVLKGLPETKFDAISGLSYEGLWFNTAKDPLTSLKVRQALSYATDRDAIVKQLFSPVQPDIKRIDTFFTPAFKDVFTDPFKVYSPVNQGKVTELMTSDGWAKGPDGIWAKGGKKATLEIKSTVNNKRRELTEQILQSQWKQAGFDLTVNNVKSGVLFGTDAPQGNFQVALYAQTPPSSDPGQCNIWCSKNIPGPSNNGNGQNWTRLALPAIDTPWDAADKELDVAKRAGLVKQGEQAVADGVPGLPIDPFPDIVVYNTGLIGGPVTHNFAYGPFFNMNEWYLKK